MDATLEEWNLISFKLLTNTVVNTQKRVLEVISRDSDSESY